ncbi:hypothetical protein TYRP_000478 [Tyrophagus putrescentiae]|nr:hypothetical protein TYRP_000478 [Tyrophagus putrescentiae]
MRSMILVKLNKLSNGSPWRHLAHQKRPLTRASLAALARPSSSDVDNDQFTSDLAALGCAMLPPQQLCSPDSPGRERRQR